jgi:hypothetical protein
MTQQERENIIHALEEKGVDAPCQRCNNLQFELLGIGYVPLNVDPYIVAVGAKIPVAILACSSCGYILQHALGALLAPVKSKEEPNG